MEYNGNKIEIRDTPEKFTGMCEVIVPALVELLSALAAAEEKANKEFQAMEAEKPSLGLNKHEAHPRFMEFWREYRETVGALVEPLFSEKLLKRGYGSHCGKPAKYSYINGNCTIFFTMKTAKKAVVETQFINCPLTMEHRFTMKPSGDRWLVDDMKYRLEGSEKWENDSV